MVVSKSASRFNIGPKLTNAIFKTFGNSNRADRSYLGSFKIREWSRFTSFNVLQISWAVFAFDYFRGAVVETNAFDEFIVRLTVTLGDKNVGCSLQIAWRFAQGAPGEEALGSKRMPAVDENDVEPVLESQVLEAVVKNECIAVEFSDSVLAAFNPVLVDDNRNILEVSSKHVRFVAGCFGIEEKRFAVADHSRGIDIVLALNLTGKTPEERLLYRFISAAENGDAPASVLE